MILQIVHELNLEMAKNLKYYWFCQLIGWTCCGLLFLLFPIVYNIKTTINNVGDSCLVTFAGVLSTHLFRQIIQRKKWLALPFKRNLIRLSLGVIFSSTLAGSIKVAGSNLLGSIILYRTFDISLSLLLTNSIDLGILIISWTAIYCLSSYIRQTRVKDSYRNRLKLRLNEMQIRGLSANINSITDSLNRIQELVDKNPSIARDKISEFSNFLRKGILEEEVQIKIQS